MLRPAAVAIIFLPRAAFAQFSTSISGTVYDSTQAVVPQASVTLT